MIAPPINLTCAEDMAGHLYLGHLAAQAEIALPGGSQDARVALTWIAAIIARDKARLWRAKLEDIEADGQPIGSWSLTARTTMRKAPSITIERHATLRQDGREIAAMADFLLRGEPQSQGASQGGRTALDDANLCDQAILILVAQARGEAIDTRLVDANGLMIHLKLKPIRSYLQLRSFLSIIISGLQKTFSRSHFSSSGS